MTTMTINTRDYNSRDSAITEVLYKVFNQSDWNVIESVKNVTYASTEGNLKFNFWTYDHTVILEVTSIDFGFGSVQLHNDNLSLTQVYEKGPYEKCECGSLCILGVFHMEDRTYCQDCIKRIVNQSHVEKTLERGSINEKI